MNADYTIPDTAFNRIDFGTTDTEISLPTDGTYFIAARSRGKSCEGTKTARCGVCFWALYDGDWCTNKNCPMKGKSVNENRVLLTNDEAVAAIHKKATVENTMKIQR